MSSPQHQSLLTRRQNLIEKESLCALPFLQRLASKKSYVLVYGIVGTTLMALKSYNGGTSTTTEKQFKIPTRVAGMISSAGEIAAMIASVVVSYMCKNGHKPRWLAAGTGLVSLSCIMSLLPYIIHGPGEDALSLTVEHGAMIQNNTFKSAESRHGLCDGGDNVTSSPAATCFEDTSSTSSVLIMMSAQIIMGIGQIVYYTIGLSYLDDNVTKDKAPILIGIIQCLRLIGPTFGSMLASFCLRMYVVPDLTPTIVRKDPRWIGAWWFGWIPLTVITAIMSLIVATFPKSLPRTAQRKALQKSQDIFPPKTKISVKDFFATMKRLCRNKILRFNSFSMVFYFFGKVGGWMFKPKYLETQFYLSASSSNLVKGSVGLISTALGVTASTVVIARFKPRPRIITAWNVFAEALEVVGCLLFAILTCKPTLLQGNTLQDGTLDLNMSCNAGCSCPASQRYAPVCDPSAGTTYFSPCHAGCSSIFSSNHTLSPAIMSREYGGCSCSESATMLEGPCFVDCSTAFIMVMAISCILKFASAAGRAGNTLVQVRCVDPSDKAMAIGLSEFLLSFLAFIPAPMVFGSIIDKACRVWGQKCDGKGNCWLYDGDKLRYNVNLVSGVFLAIATLMDVGVWYYSRDLELFDPEEKKEEEEKEKIQQEKL